MNESILVTGGCGFIGIHVVSELLHRGYNNITVLDNLFNGKKQSMECLSSDVNFIEMDINSDLLSKVFADGKFTTVIHLAALHYIPYCDSHALETCRVNVEGTQNILDTSLKYDVKRFFHASTAAVYANKESAHLEGDPLIPLDIYGISKLTNEHQVALSSRKSDTTFRIGRFFNSIGAFETNPHLVPELVTRLNKSNKIEIGNVEPKRDYIHVKDKARAVLDMTFGGDDKLDICNIGSGKCYSVLEVVETIGNILQKEIELIPSQKYMRTVDRLLLLSDIQKIENKYGWIPQCTLEDGLRYALDFANNKCIKL